MAKPPAPAVEPEPHADTPPSPPEPELQTAVAGCRPERACTGPSCRLVFLECSALIRTAQTLGVRAHQIVEVDRDEEASEIRDLLALEHDAPDPLRPQMSFRVSSIVWLRITAAGALERSEAFSLDPAPPTGTKDPHFMGGLVWKDAFDSHFRDGDDVVLVAADTGDRFSWTAPSGVPDRIWWVRCSGRKCEQRAHDEFAVTGPLPKQRLSRKVVSELEGIRSFRDDFARDKACHFSSAGCPTSMTGLGAAGLGMGLDGAGPPAEPELASNRDELAFQSSSRVLYEHRGAQFEVDDWKRIGGGILTLVRAKAQKDYLLAVRMTESFVPVGPPVHVATHEERVDIVTCNSQSCLLSVASQTDTGDTTLVVHLVRLPPSQLDSNGAPSP